MTPLLPCPSLHGEPSGARLGEKSCVVKASGPEVKLQTEPPVVGLDAGPDWAGGLALPAIMTPVFSEP